MAGRGRLAFRILIALVAVGTAIVLAPRQTHLDGVWHLAERLLHGQAGFTERTAWWEMYERDGRFYLPYAPLAAVPLIPFVAIFGTERIGQPIAQAIFLLISALLLWKLLANRRRTRPVAELAALVYLFATPWLAALCLGTVWYLLHAEGNLFLLAALLCCQRKYWAAFGFFVAMAVGCRNGLLPAALGLALLLGPRRKYRRRFLPTLAGAAFPTLLALWLNWQATGSLLTTTYQLAYAEWQQLPVYELANLPFNASIFFLARPEPDAQFPFIKFHTEGDALWSLSPFFLLITLARPWRTRQGRAFVIAAVCTFLPYLFFRWHGEQQVGTRYMHDLFPFLFPLLAEAVVTHKTRLYYGLWVILLLVALYYNAAAALLIKQARLTF